MDKIEELLTRGVDKIYPSKEDLEKVLRSGKKLKLYQGFDPTGTELHIGHMIGLRKLRQWQDLGHHVIFLIGDGTGQAGDPKKTAREKVFTRDELRKNAVDYVKQAGKIVRFEGENPVKVLFNGDWLSKLGYSEILELLGHFSLQQLSERDLFAERLKREEPIVMREFIYPILQGYDSVAMEVDLEIGGTDQTFNMLCGRTLVKNILKKNKFVMTTPLLTDSKGVKIGKSEGNVIALRDNPNDLFGKIMALGDDVIVKGLEYLTDLSIADIDVSTNPMKYKKQLAFEIVRQLNNQDAAKKAQEEFENVVQKGNIPIETIEIPRNRLKGAKNLDLFFSAKVGESKSYIKKVLEQKGGRLNNQILNPNDDAEHAYKPENIYEFGRKRFKIKLGHERP